MRVLLSGPVSFALLIGCGSGNRKGLPAGTISCAEEVEAGLSHSTALAMKIGKEIRSGQVLWRVSNPTQITRWRSRSPVRIKGVCGESTSETAHGGVLIPIVSLTWTLSK